MKKIFWTFGRWITTVVDHKSDVHWICNFADPSNETVYYSVIDHRVLELSRGSSARLIDSKAEYVVWTFIDLDTFHSRTSTSFIAPTGLLVIFRVTQPCNDMDDCEFTMVINHLGRPQGVVCLRTQFNDRASLDLESLRAFRFLVCLTIHRLIPCARLFHRLSLARSHSGALRI